MPMSMDINEEMPATFVIEFTNGKERTIVCERVVIDTRGHPICIDTIYGTRYYFNNIISLRRSE